MTTDFDEDEIVDKAYEALLKKKKERQLYQQTDEEVAFEPEPVDQNFVAYDDMVMSADDSFGGTPVDYNTPKEVPIIGRLSPVKDKLKAYLEAIGKIKRGEDVIVPGSGVREAKEWLYGRQYSPRQKPTSFRDELLRREYPFQTREQYQRYLERNQRGGPQGTGYTRRTHYAWKKGYLFIPPVKKPPRWNGRGVNIFKDSMRDTPQNIFKQSRKPPPFKPHMLTLPRRRYYG